MAILLNKDFDGLKSKLARSLKETLARDCETPSGEKPMRWEMHIPYHQIVPSEEDNNTATAVVTYVVQCPREKSHTVRIKFAYDNTGRFLKESMLYV
jgi:hypothetical protein